LLPDGEDAETMPRWSICFNLRLDHIRASGLDWFADVRAIVEFLRDLARETETEFTVEIRYRSRLWYSEHLSFVDASHGDSSFMKEMIEPAT
jgi:hypothetical protein